MPCFVGFVRGVAPDPTSQNGRDRRLQHEITAIDARVDKHVDVVWLIRGAGNAGRSCPRRQIQRVDTTSIRRTRQTDFPDTYALRRWSVGSWSRFDPWRAATGGVSSNGAPAEAIWQIVEGVEGCANRQTAPGNGKG